MFDNNSFFYYENLGFEKTFCAPLAKDKLWDAYTMAWMTVY